MQEGTLRVIDSEGRLTEFVGSDEPVATIRLHDPDLPLKLFRSPETFRRRSLYERHLDVRGLLSRGFSGSFFD